ncbi:MAG: type VII toxin-antitoxin system HepT family RNase toxin [Myxococcota bacterium]
MRRKVERLSERLSKLLALAPSGLPPHEQERDLAAYYLVLAVELCSDLAEHLIADRGLGAPGTVGEEFDILARHGIVTGELAKQLREAVGLRNVLVHQYTDVDWKRVDAALRDLARLERFAAEMLRAGAP